MTATIRAAAVRGRIAAPPSKSAAHRALITAALAGGGRVRGVLPSEDMRATLRAIRALGVVPLWDGDAVTIGPGTGPPMKTVDCGESGTTLRLLLPVLVARGAACTLTGQGRLPRRPLSVYADLLHDHGASMSADRLPLTLGGRLSAGRYALRGDVSSQFFSGLLLALPLCEGDSRLEATTPLESAGYVAMTTDAMAAAGVRVREAGGGWDIPGGQAYRPRDAAVEGDWSQAAFLLAMGALGGEATVTGLDMDSRQGDRVIVGLLREMGADIAVSGGAVTCRAAPLRGIAVNAADIPDLVPVLAVLGALAEGVTTITGAARLRIKESDRLEAMAGTLNALGGRVKKRPDGLVITGVPRLRGGTADGWNDHRVVMSLAVAALRCEGPVTVTGAGAVAKSWPDFFEDYTSCGGDVHVVHPGE